MTSLHSEYAQALVHSLVHCGYVREYTCFQKIYTEGAPSLKWFRKIIVK